jgi:hypothetical protein
MRITSQLGLAAPPESITTVQESNLHFPGLFRRRRK